MAPHPPRAPRLPPQEGRRGAYKPRMDVGQARRRREDSLLDLRRRQRNAGLFKRRRDESIHASASPPDSNPDPPASSEPPSPPQETTTTLPEPGTLSEMLDGVRSDDVAVQLVATTQLRKLLSVGKDPPVRQVVCSDVLPIFVEFLSRHEFPQLQLEAAWVLTNIASSAYALLVAECGAIPGLVKLLESPDANIRDQAVWALGNVAADSPSCRELVLDHGALPPLLAQFKEGIKIPMLRTATWALSNLCLGKLPAEVQVMPILEIIRLLIRSIDEKILADACRALYYLCSGTDDSVEGIVDAGICQQLVNLLMRPSTNILIPVILALARISAGDDAQVQILLDNGLLHRLVPFLTRNYPTTIRKHICLIVSNITAGNSAHIQAVIDANFISPLLKLLKSAEMDVKRESAWALSNAALGGSSDQIQYLVSQGCLEPLCSVLTYQDPDLLYACLHGLQNILKVGEMEKQQDKDAMNPYAQLIQECGGLAILEDLQGFDNSVIFEKVIEMLESYWEEECDEPNIQGSHDSAGDSAEPAEAVLDAPEPPPSSSANEAD